MRDITDLGDIWEIPARFDIVVPVKYNLKANIRNKSGANVSQLLADINKTPEELVSFLDQVLREAISANIWRTRNGVDDIISSSKLLRSQNISYGNNSIQIRYDVPYAALVHYGGYIIPYGRQNARPVYIPPRPWVYNVLTDQFDGFNLRAIYADIIKRVLTKF